MPINGILKIPIYKIQKVLHIQTPRLSKIYHYNSDQTKLYRIIKFLKEKKNLGYKSNFRNCVDKKIFNGEMSIRTMMKIKSDVGSVDKKIMIEKQTTTTVTV